MLFVIILIVFAVVFSLHDVSKKEHEKAKDDFKRITGHKYH